MPVGIIRPEAVVPRTDGGDGPQDQGEVPRVYAVRAIVDNDAKLVRAYALDKTWLEQLDVRVDSHVSFEVRRPTNPPTPFTIEIRFDDTFDVRLDRLLSRELGVSRNRLKQWHRTGRIVILAGSDRPLRRNAQEGQRIAIQF